MEKGVIELFRDAMIKARQIERSVFFYWATMETLEFTDWGRVQRMCGCKEIAILWQRMMIAPFPPHPPSRPAVTREIGHKNIVAKIARHFVLD